MRILLICLSVLLLASFARGGEKIEPQQAAPVVDDIPFENLDGFVPPEQIGDEIAKMVGKYDGGGKEDADAGECVRIQQERGVVQTGLTPVFIDGADCPEIDSEKWAIDYTGKREGRPALHKGVDIPQPRGTPILAVADGTVVGKFPNRHNRKGIEIMLRHTPAQAGLKYWTYSQYTHLREMSPLPIGAQVKMGQEIGKTANTGSMGKRVRRDALHFAILYSESPDWTNDGKVVMPRDGYFMDPVAFYRLEPPYDSQALAKMPREKKQTPTPYLTADGIPVPADTKRIWPFPACAKKKR
jgi:murein DD-endopeptidase MepM/ murein hydrolase activator NlpD